MNMLKACSSAVNLTRKREYATKEKRTAHNTSFRAVVSVLAV